MEPVTNRRHGDTVAREHNGAKSGMPPQYNMNGYMMFKTLASRLAGAQFV